MPYTFYAEINANNSKLWDLFVSLSEELPEIAALLFGFYDSDLNYGKYVSKDEIIRALKKYEREVAEDCHLEIGLIYNTESELTEIFIAESKYIQFWGTNEGSFRKIMLDFNLKEISDIEFIDEYPKVVYPLKRIVNDVAESYEIVADLKEKFIR